jgi:hypothetical protein
VDETVPVLLLDLDGVLNPFAAAACPDGHQERVLFDGEEPVRFCPAHGDWIRELVAAGELWWATGWGENANERADGAADARRHEAQAGGDAEGRGDLAARALDGSCGLYPPPRYDPPLILIFGRRRQALDWPCGKAD